MGMEARSMAPADNITGPRGEKRGDVRNEDHSIAAELAEQSDGVEVDCAGLKAGPAHVAKVHVCSSMEDQSGGLWVKSQCVLDNDGVACTWNSIQQWSEFTGFPVQSLL